MFSVIIPLYNKAPYIEKAIRSVAVQTCQEFELIVIDDGSQDDPLPPKGGNGLQRLSFLGNCSEFLEKVRIVEQKNQGVSVTRNKGVKLAKYDYIAFLDADDWWAPTFLEEMKKVIEKFPDIHVFCAGFYTVKDSKLAIVNLGVSSDFRYGKVDYIDLLLQDNCRPLWIGASIISRRVFDIIGGFRKELKYGEDFDLFIRAYLVSGMVLLNKQLSYYNQDADPLYRAISQKLYPKENSAFWNLDYHLYYNDSKVKQLVEYLKLRSFVPYYRAGVYIEDIEKEIDDIKFSNHRLRFLFIYKIIPVVIQNRYYWFVSLLSRLKKTVKLCIK